MTGQKDNLYANPLGDVAGFSFNEEVVRVFPDMIKRSVPGYQTIINMTGQLAALYAKPGSNCYDLGCSLGASSLAMASAIQEGGCRIVAVDNSPAMIHHCEKLLNTRQSRLPVQLIESDIQDIEIANASVVVLNFTLQFVPLAQRDSLMRNIAAGLLPGGILVLSEKVAFEDIQHQHLMEKLHHDFKRAQGYSDLEISQKRTALEDVLIPETLTIHRTRLKNAGFRAVDVWFQCFNFASIIAIKDE